MLKVNSGVWHLPDAQTVWASLSIGFLLFWQQLALHSVVPEAPRSLAPLLGGMGGAVGWIAFVAALTVSSAVFFAVSRAFPPMRDHDASLGLLRLVLGCACMVVGSVLLLWIPDQVGAVMVGGGLAGIGFALAAQMLLLLIVSEYSGARVSIPLMRAFLVQLVCACGFVWLPVDVTLGLLCCMPALFGCCMFGYWKSVRLAGRSGRKDPGQAGICGPGCGVEIGAALARRDARSALIVCFGVFFFAILYTNITGARFGSFTDGDLLNFNLKVTIAKCLVIMAIIIVTRNNMLRALPVVAVTLFATAMLVVSFAPDSSEAFLVADTFAAAGRMLAFVYILLVVDVIRRCGRLESCGAALLVMGVAGVAVLLSTLGGWLIQGYVQLDTERFALVTAVVLYALLLASNALLRSGRDKPLVVQFGGDGVDEEVLSQRRAQALAARFPQLTARETEIVALILLGLTAQSVAGRLSISENTAKTHMRRIYQKLDVHSRQDLLELAYETAPLKQG